MNHGSLFSGIGGFDLAAEWAGWKNIFHCEWNEFGKTILKYYWPNAISYHDITKTDFTIHRGTIDILTGGFPCQGQSVAGKRKGRSDNRWLWPEMLRAIQEIKPKYIVGENVTGIISIEGGLVFEQVQIDLENEGYEVQPFILPACSTGAPHRRDRVWFVAKNTNRNGWGSNQWESEPSFRGFGNIGTGNNERIRTDNDKVGTVTNPTIDGHTDGHTPTERTQRSSEERRLQQFEGESNDTANTCILGLEGSKVNGGINGSWAQPYKQPPGFIRSNWQNFPTQSPVCSGNDGLPSRLDGITFPKWRNESIKAAGNAIVPNVAYQIFKAINEYENLPNQSNHLLP